MLNINNIPALTDIKPNFAVYGRVHILESDKAHKIQQFENQMMPAQNISNREKSMTLIEPNSRDKDDPRETSTPFRKRLFGP